MNIALYLTDSRASAPFPWQKREVCRLQRAKKCLFSNSIHPPTGQVNCRLFELIFLGICKAKGQFLGITYPAVIRWLVSRKTYFVSSNNVVKTSSTDSHTAAILQGLHVGISSYSGGERKKSLPRPETEVRLYASGCNSAILLNFWFLRRIRQLR